MTPRPSAAGPDEHDWDRQILASARRWRERGWVAEADALATVKSLLRAQRTYLRRADQLLATFALNEARYEVLLAVFLADGETLGHGEIARRLQVSPAAVTSAVDKLRRAGYLTRTEMPIDRRHKQAALTDDGRAVILAATTTMNAQVFAATGMSGSELRQLQRLLTKLSKSMHPATA